jgi:TonB family protein
MTSKRGAWCGLTCIATLWAWTGSACAQDTTALLDRLHRAEMSNSIDDAQMKPWHLILSFQLFDEKGAPTEKGLVEEWWKSPSMHRTVFRSPSYTSTEILTPDGLYRTKGASSAPDLLELILQEVVHPMPSKSDIESSKPDMQSLTFGKVKLDCVMLAQEIKHVAHAPVGLFPTYCFDPGRDSLRVSYNYGSQLTARNNMGTFLGRSVAVNQSTSFYFVNAITAHLETLQTASLGDSDFALTPDLEKVDENAPVVSDHIASGLIIRQPKPVYPQGGGSGRVQIAATIGRDGRVHSMKLLSTPDSDLAIAALAAVRQWTYKPYLLNGKPTEVTTTMTVNFMRR